MDDRSVENIDTGQEKHMEKKPNMAGKRGRRGRKPSRVDQKTKLEKSRQSARECRARKKLRYQYLEELVTNREKAILALREELEMCKKLSEQIDSGQVQPEEALNKLQSRRTH
ncbi:cAMP-responsive element-binding protein-like 2 [Lingula anatina]|uniref:cAMP-responsive element-binding protein-like 2 n=1 Tax=Lingula anatina TaxID=7574 RepID=A0A1S3KDV7_LINAN|nr:cAMP-responsive element-binding protein-like 2 [Lingula anatina]|eukprot:XP_013420810.1 cAMP-responsive element-binding protein-like 2 [Lingula anatina]